MPVQCWLSVSDFDLMNQGNGSHGQLEAAAAAILPAVGPNVALTPLPTKRPLAPDVTDSIVRPVIPWLFPIFHPALRSLPPDK
jgi:hypothetical protein